MALINTANPLGIQPTVFIQPQDFSLLRHSGPLYLHQALLSSLLQTYVLLQVNFIQGKAIVFIQKTLQGLPQWSSG